LSLTQKIGKAPLWQMKAKQYISPFTVSTLSPMKLLKSTYQNAIKGVSLLVCILFLSSCCSETEDCACSYTPAFKVYTTKYSPTGNQIYIYLQDTTTGAIQDSLYIGKSFSAEVDTAGKNIFVYTVNENERLFKDRNPRTYRMIFSHKDLNVSDTLQHLLFI
jgi:hypothetical protein